MLLTGEMGVSICLDLNWHVLVSYMYLLHLLVSLLLYFVACFIFLSRHKYSTINQWILIKLLQFDDSTYHEFI